MKKIKFRKQFTIAILSFNFFCSILQADSPGAKLKPQTKVEFEKAQIAIGEKTIDAEIATTSEQHSYGLMNRLSLPEDFGMLFVFSKEEIQTFWMKNTFVDLSIGFFDEKQRLVDIQDMEAVKSVMEQPKTYTSKSPAKYALEVSRGWFLKNKIKHGAKFKIIRSGPL
ncbi:MAG: DUF192 domain-containing protein [Bdellovibrionota bacterium]